MDTYESLSQAVMADWAMARHGGGLDRVVQRASAGSDEGADALMDAVRDVLIREADAVYCLFDTATCFGHGDFTHIDSHGYKELIGSCGLIEHKAGGLNSARWDELVRRADRMRVVHTPTQCATHRLTPICAFK